MSSLISWVLNKHCLRTQEYSPSRNLLIPTTMANKIIVQNCYPESCDIISNVEQGSKVSNTYEREKTGRVRSHNRICIVILGGSRALNLRMLVFNVGYVWFSWNSTQFLSRNLPQVWARLWCRVGVRLNTRKSKIGEAALL